MFNLVIFGPPGSGKGTQSDRIIEKCGLVHLSTGDLLRAEKNSGSELGKTIMNLIDKGELVSDEMVGQLVRTFVLNNSQANGFIFDGFPRTVKQAAWLDKLLAELNTGVTVMLSLNVEDGELKNRLLARGCVSGRADDQDVAIIENRIKVYHQQTMPVMDFYRKQKKYTEVDGVGSFDEVFYRISQSIECYKQ
jgi:adenylate kinase